MSQCTSLLTPASMIGMEHIQAIMRPRGVAVVGATNREGSVGNTICRNLQAEGRQFELYMVNPKRVSVLGDKCWPSVSAIEGTPDLAVVVTPAAVCAQVLEDCAASGKVRGVVVIAAGFKEVGAEGLKMEEQLVEIAAHNNMAIVGPNCLGVQSPHHLLNASFAAAPARPGPVAFISQSGAMCTAVLDWSLETRVGFSAFVSLGSMAHVDWGSLLTYFGEDADTQAVIMYMESIGDARGFVAAATSVARRKPIIVIKAGKTEAAAAAAVSHTGSMTGSYDTFVAALRRCGCQVVGSMKEFENVALLMAKQPAPRSEHAVVITNAGGPGVLCTDAVCGAGMQLAHLQPNLIAKLSQILPAAWSRNNPIDVLGDATENGYQRTLETLIDEMNAPNGRDSGLSPDTALLVLLSPQSVTRPLETAKAVTETVAKARQAGRFRGPLVCSWMGGPAVSSSKDWFHEQGIPCYEQPDMAAYALGHWVQQQKLAMSMTQAPKSLGAEETAGGRQLLNRLIETYKATHGTQFTLSEHDSKELLMAYGLPVAAGIVCTSEQEAVAAVASNRVGGFPVVMKIHGGKFTHKSDIGGVHLNLNTQDQVLAAFRDIETSYRKLDPAGFEGVTVQKCVDVKGGTELIFGCTQDPQLGPIITFGAGGTMVEIFKDVATTPAPLGIEEAAKLVKSTMISKALLTNNDERSSSPNQRFKGCNPGQLYSFISRFSLVCVDLWEYVTECEMNPVIAGPQTLIALDARIVIDTEKRVVDPAMTFLDSLQG
ncbi:putative acetyl-CoA synthetase [Gregarina niphandrodes]|uniref:Acetyl-CoA synthetase n=1 Tax=Gregarina niphandrodes TaxID=110365 RepID=A0A023B538_GRENI|nr:putative acetyl-CoA synthetase [Gregarina niphandrodes]EZG58341.1 putative acetyl-CoA synthetase [Gregarina niphandrodes]|eukprot:XP_011130974.1 putative acetyl-CoA synthetase [Gregarina niphandrodes]